EIVGPASSRALAEFFLLSQTDIDAALLALEAEGFVLRGRFHPSATELEWCDRRLLARIHRLTINRLRAEIQPVSPADFQRFLLAWQRVDAGHRAEGPEGVEAVLELLDGYELPAAAWGQPELLPDTEQVLKTLSQAGALFFKEIVRQTGLLPSRVEQALGELAAQAWVTADSFEGLRALLIPSEKRERFTDVEHKRRHRTVTSVEFAGRWSLLRTTESNRA